MSENTLSDQQVDAYLELLGFDPQVVREAPRDQALLDDLIYAQQITVPFQTVSINRGQRTPSLALDDLFDKIVVKRWGGFCFELNKLFEALLRGLGYEVRPLYSRSVRGRDVRMPINHRAMFVMLDGRLAFADVGFGGPLPAGALMLEDGRAQTIRGERFIPRLIKPGHWSVDRQTRSAHDNFDDGVPEHVQSEIELYELEVEDVDFELLNKALSAPGALFCDTLLVNLRTDAGHKSMRDSVLTIREDGQKQVIELTDDRQLAEALETHFGLVGILPD